MRKIDIGCYVVSGCFLVASVVSIIVGTHYHNTAKEIRENNVSYVVVEDTNTEVDTETQVDDIPTEPTKEKKEIYVSAEDAQKFVENSTEWKQRMASIENVVYTWPQLESVEPVGNSMRLIYVFESSSATMKCSYNKVTGKVKVGQIYNSIDKKYPVLFWQCGHVPDVNDIALEKFYQIGYHGIYTCEGDDGATTIGFMDNDGNSDVIYLD